MPAYIYIYIYIYWAGRHYIGPIVPMFPALVYWMHLDLIYTMPLHALLRDVPCCLLFLLNLFFKNNVHSETNFRAWL